MIESITRTRFEYARMLAEWWIGDLELPLGTFKRIGEGTFRIAYLCEDGNIYKTPIDEFEFSSNYDEYRNWKKLRNRKSFEWRGNKWRLPDFMEYYVFPEIGTDTIEGYDFGIIVTEYVSGRTWDFCEDGCGATGEHLEGCAEYTAFEQYSGLIDGQYDNVLIEEDGTRVIIDLQC